MEYYLRKFRISTDIIVHGYVHDDDGLCDPSQCSNHKCKFRVVKTLMETPELDKVAFDVSVKPFDSNVSIVSIAFSKRSRENYMSKLSTLIDIIPDVDDGLIGPDLYERMFELTTCLRRGGNLTKEFIFDIIIRSLIVLKITLKRIRTIIMHTSDDIIYSPVVITPLSEELTIIIKTAVAQNYFHDLKTETGEEITYSYIEDQLLFSKKLIRI